MAKKKEEETEKLKFYQEIGKMGKENRKKKSGTGYRSNLMKISNLGLLLAMLMILALQPVQADEWPMYQRQLIFI